MTEDERRQQRIDELLPGQAKRKKWDRLAQLVGQIAARVAGLAKRLNLAEVSEGHVDTSGIEWHLAIGPNSAWLQESNLTRKEEQEWDLLASPAVGMLAPVNGLDYAVGALAEIEGKLNRRPGAKLAQLDDAIARAEAALKEA